MLFCFFGVGVSPWPLDRETHWRIEMPFMKRPVYSIGLVCVTIGSLEIKIWLESRSRIVFLFFELVCHTVLSIVSLIERSRCHSSSDQYTLPSDFLCDYWELRAQIVIGIRTRMLPFFFKTWCIALSSRSREPSRDRGVTHEATNAHIPYELSCVIITCNVINYTSKLIRSWELRKYLNFRTIIKRK